MSVEAWTTILVILSFIVYTYIGWRSSVKDSNTGLLTIEDKNLLKISEGKI